MDIDVDVAPASRADIFSPSPSPAPHISSALPYTFDFDIIDVDVPPPPPPPLSRCSSSPSSPAPPDDQDHDGDSDEISKPQIQQFNLFSNYSTTIALPASKPAEEDIPTKLTIVTTTAILTADELRDIKGFSDEEIAAARERHRSEGYYFTSSKADTKGSSQKKKWDEMVVSAVSGEDVVKASGNIYWSCRVPWKVIRLKVVDDGKDENKNSKSKNSKKAITGIVQDTRSIADSKQEQSTSTTMATKNQKQSAEKLVCVPTKETQDPDAKAKRRRPNKKRRIILRKKKAAEAERAEKQRLAKEKKKANSAKKAKGAGGQAAAVHKRTEEEDKEKRTRMNRLKKVKRKQKMLAKKAEDQQQQATQSKD